MTQCEILHILPCCNFSTRAEWSEFGLCQRYHRGRGIGKKYIEAALGEEHCIFTCTSAQFQDTASRRKFSQQRCTHRAPLCSYTEPLSEAQIEGRRNDIEGKSRRTHRSRHRTDLPMSRRQRRDSHIYRI